jgi:hypothetical protein
MTLRGHKGPTCSEFAIASTLSIEGQLWGGLLASSGRRDVRRDTTAADAGSGNNADDYYDRGGGLLTMIGKTRRKTKGLTCGVL